MSDTVSGNHFQSKMELIDELAYIKMLEQPAAEKAKEAEAFTCRGCTGKYTDATSSGAKSKKNYGYCSMKCREDQKKAPRVRVPCEHGRQKARCKDCVDMCKHRRQKRHCRDCRASRQ